MAKLCLCYSEIIGCYFQMDATVFEQVFTDDSKTQLIRN